jgi:hypothetical protein
VWETVTECLCNCDCECVCDRERVWEIVTVSMCDCVNALVWVWALTVSACVTVWLRVCLWLCVSVWVCVCVCVHARLLPVWSQLPDFLISLLKLSQWRTQTTALSITRTFSSSPEPPARLRGSPTLLLSEWYGLFLLRVKRPWGEADNLLPSNSKFKNACVRIPSRLPSVTPT